ncbi:MAG: hypothetical protein ACK5L2_19185 [Planctomyces sp.]|jgi:MYXO-CTERM domain-containing protein
MIRVLGAVAAVVLATACAEAGIILSIANQTVNAGSSFSVDVLAEATGGTSGANSFVLDFQIVSLSGANPGVVGQVSHAVPAAVPNFSNPNYVFFGDSFADTLWAGGTGITSWSVSTINPAWNNDTYNMSDMTNSLTNATLLTSRYLATLYFDVTAAAAGEYQILLGSSEFDADDANPFGELPVFPVMASGSNAGIITVNGLTSVPEPGSAVFGALLLFAAAAWQRRRRLSETPAAHQ